MNILFRFFKSIKLAIILILIITGLSLLSTLIPQNMGNSYYLSHYSDFLAKIIIGLRIYRFFSSWIFLIPALIFFLNLLTCTLYRFIRELGKKDKRRFGPDLLHTGLLVLLIGGVLTFSGRMEGYVNLREGERIQLPGGYVLILEDFEFLTYENGTPKDWISTVDIMLDGKMIFDSYPIEVNKPLKVGEISIYQHSYTAEGSSVLQAVTDPGFVPVLIGLILLAAGLFLTYYQKLRDSQ